MFSPKWAFFSSNLRHLMLLISMFFTSNVAQAGAKRGLMLAPKAGGCTANSNDSAISTPTPLRKVLLQPFSAKTFHLPNGAAIDISADLQSILMTAITSTQSLSPTDSADFDTCETHLELRSAMTVFQLDMAELGISFGYTNSGELSLVTGVTNRDTVQVGTVAMDFSVWKCTGGNCSAIAAASSSSFTAGVQVDLEIDFSSVRLGPNFVYNTPLGGVLRSIMVNGLQQLDQSTRLNELPWQARVKDYNPAIGVLIFDAGSQYRLSTNQAFEIYAPTDSSATGGCNVYQTVAYVHTTAVNTSSSTAAVDQILDNRGIQNGDVVMIRSVGNGR